MGWWARQLPLLGLQVAGACTNSCSCTVAQHAAKQNHPRLLTGWRPKTATTDHLRGLLCFWQLTLPDVPDLAVDLVQHARELVVLCLWHHWQAIDDCRAARVCRQQQQFLSDTCCWWEALLGLLRPPLHTCGPLKHTDDRAEARLCLQVLIIVHIVITPDAKVLALGQDQLINVETLKGKALGLILEQL